MTRDSALMYVGRNDIDIVIARDGDLMHHARCLRAAIETNGDDLTEALAAVLATTRCRELDCVIARPSLQLRHLDDVPPMRARALREMVAAQPHRFFRAAGAGALCTDVRWLPATGKGPVAVAIAAAEELVAAIESTAERAGWAGVSIGGDQADSAGLRLQTLGRTAFVRQRLLRECRRWAAAAAVVWTAVAAAAVVRAALQHRRVVAALRASERPARVVTANVREIDAIEMMLRAVAVPPTDRSSPLAATMAIARALPDSAFLTTLELDDRGRGSLSGSAPVAARVLSNLDSSRAVTNARVVGPTVAEVQGGQRLERFALSFGAVAR